MYLKRIKFSSFFFFFLREKEDKRKEKKQTLPLSCSPRPEAGMGLECW